MRWLAAGRRVGMEVARGASHGELASATVTCEAAAGWRWSLLFLRRFNKITKRWDDAEPIHWHLLYPVFRTRQSGSVQVGVLASPGLRRCDGTSTACQARGANEGLGHGVKVSVGGGQWSPRCCWSSLALWTVAAVAQRRQQYGVRGRQFHGAEKKWLATWMVSLPPLTLLGARKLKHLGRGSRSVSTLTDDVGSPSFTKQLGDPPWRPTTRCLLQPDGKEGSSSRQSPWKKGALGRSLNGIFVLSLLSGVLRAVSAIHARPGCRQSKRHAHPPWTPAARQLHKGGADKARWGVLAAPALSLLETIPETGANNIRSRHRCAATWYGQLPKKMGRLDDGRQCYCWLCPEYSARQP